MTKWIAQLLHAKLDNAFNDYSFIAGVWYCFLAILTFSNHFY